MRRLAGEGGQAAVESAIVLPLTIFLLLGSLQMILLYQARVATEYAAFRAVRAGSLGRASCPLMTTAALQALLPTATRSDVLASGPGVMARWAGFLTNSYRRHWVITRSPDRVPPAGMNPPIVTIRIREDDLLDLRAGADFDALRAADAAVPQLTIELTHWYELRIPFANYVIHAAWQATTYFGPVNALIPIGDDLDAGKAPRHGNPERIDDLARIPGYRGAYLVPIRAQWSLRQMSDLLPGAPMECREAMAP